MTVWVRDVARDTDRNADLALLSRAERSRLSRYARDEDRDRFSTAWALARRTLGHLLDLEPRDLRFERRCKLCGDDRHGKPRLSDGPLEFSIAHAGDRVLLAVADRVPVGVDLEPSHTVIDDVATWVTHPDETGLRGRELLNLWVRKEAVLKATGHGLARPMTEFPVLAAPAGFFLADLDLGAHFVGAVAAVSDTPLAVDVISMVAAH